MKIKILYLFVFILLVVSFVFANISKAQTESGNPCSGIPDGTSCFAGGQSGTCQGGNCTTLPANSSSNPSTASTNPNLDNSSGVYFPTNTNLPDPQGGIAYIISNVLYWILGIFGFLAIISFIISGTQYILSAGNERAVDTAKRNMTYSIIGVAVALSGLIIIFAINNILIGTNPAF